MTTEILRNSIFENPEHLSEVEYVIFDEVHYMDDQERGSVWEESLIFAPEKIRFICLSATIPNVQELGAWLREIRGPDMVVIQSLAAARAAPPQAPHGEERHVRVQGDRPRAEARARGGGEVGTSAGTEAAS